MQYQVVIENFSKHFKNCSCLVRKMLNQSKYFNIKRTESNTFCIGERGGGGNPLFYVNLLVCLLFVYRQPNMRLGHHFNLNCGKKCGSKSGGRSFSHFRISGAGILVTCMGRVGLKRVSIKVQPQLCYRIKGLLGRLQSTPKT